MAEESTNPFAEEVASDLERNQQKEESKKSAWQKMKKYTSKAWNVAKFALGIGGGDGSSGSYSDLSESTAGWHDKKGLEKEYTDLVSQKKDLQGEIDSLTKETKGIDFFKLLGEYSEVKEVQNLTKINKLKGEEASLLRERDSAMVSLMGGYDLSDEDKQNRINEVQQLVEKLSNVREELANRQASTQKQSVMSKIFSLREARKLVNKVVSKFGSDDKDTKAVAMNSIEGGLGPTVIVKKLDIIQIKVDILRNEILRRINELDEKISSGEFGVSAANNANGTGNGEGEEEGSILDEITEFIGEEATEAIVKKGAKKAGRLAKRGWRGAKSLFGRLLGKRGRGLSKLGRTAGKLSGKLGKYAGSLAKKPGLMGRVGRTVTSVGSKVLGKTGIKAAAKAVGAKAISTAGKKLLTKSVGRVFKRVALNLASRAAAKGVAYTVAGAVPVVGWVAGAAIAVWDAYSLMDELVLEPRKRKTMLKNLKGVDDATWKKIVTENLTQEFIDDKGWGKDELNTVLNLPNYAREAVDDEAVSIMDGAIEGLGIDNIQALVAPYSLLEERSVKDQIRLQQEGVNLKDLNSGNESTLSLISKNLATFGMYSVYKAYKQGQANRQAAEIDRNWNEQTGSPMGPGPYMTKSGTLEGGTYVDSGMQAQPMRFGAPVPQDADKHLDEYLDHVRDKVPLLDKKMLKKEREEDKKKGQAAVIKEYEEATGKKIKFKFKNDNHSIRRLHPEIIDEIDKLAKDLGVNPQDFVITSSVSDILGRQFGEAGHSETSKHYKGLAVDIRTADNPKIRGKLYQWVQEHGRATTDKSGRRVTQGPGKGYWVRPDKNTRTLFEDPNGRQEHIHFELNTVPPSFFKNNYGRAGQVPSLLQGAGEGPQQRVGDVKTKPNPDAEKKSSTSTVEGPPKTTDNPNAVASNQKGTIINYNTTNVTNTTETKSTKSGIENNHLNSEIA